MSESSNSGFFSRWSRMKTHARQDETSAPPLLDARTQRAPAAPSVAQEATAPAATPNVSGTQETRVAPTLDDVQQLTPQSDYRAFVGEHVATEVKNAAMKKLFSDPHFNVMDGLDIYIDDYSQPDPLSPATLRQMVSAKFLQLVDEDPSTHGDASTGDTLPPSANAHPTPSQSSEHDHPDLRLQSDASAGRKDAGPESV